jgi:hypothetical protein
MPVSINSASCCSLARPSPQLSTKPGQVQTIRQAVFQNALSRCSDSPVQVSRNVKVPLTYSFVRPQAAFASPATFSAHSPVQVSWNFTVPAAYSL